MKKILFLLLLCIGTAAGSQAQTFAEWFSQKKTQKKYLLQQIAALQAYIGYARQGYDIAQEGLGAISDFKNGEFNLHSLYFGSLKAINPAVKQYPRVGDIIDLQNAIAQATDQSRAAVAKGQVFSPSELSFINAVYGNLQKDCGQTITDLENVTTPGKLEMKDDERLKRIDKLFADSQGQYRFIKSYAASLNIMAIQKRSELRSLEQIQSNYAIQ